jgi:hypothetical protein
MANARLNPLEKSSVQARHGIKRLEVFVDTTRNEGEKQIAEQILEHFRAIQKLIPSEYRNVDIQK